MKLLLFSDVHVDLEAARKLCAKARGVDFVIGAGDFANARRDLQKCIDVLREIAVPTILVAGNNESTEELKEACTDWSNALVLHGEGIHMTGSDANGRRLDEVSFFGIGGGIPVTPFGSWSYDFSEEEARELLAPCPSGCVLVSHSPPKGTVDRSSSGQNLGSEALREAILKVRPALVVCGHIHGSAGRHEILGTSPVVNAGPAGMVWELPNFRATARA